MSKFELQKAALKSGGVSYEESLEAQQLSPSIYDRIGGEEGFFKLSESFYDRVFQDKDAVWFLNIFSSSTRDEAIDNQYRFLVQTFGGPPLYRQKKKGTYTRLVGRHANYTIGHKAARRWVEHMVAAIGAHQVLGGEEESEDGIKEVREKLIKYFTYTAHYIVAAMEFMRSDQLSGGTQTDPGRVW